MNIGCPFCGKQYQIDGKKIQKDKVRVKCKACGHFITVERPASKPGESGEMDLLSTAPGASREKPVDDALAPPGRDASSAMEENDSSTGEDGAPFSKEKDSFEKDDWPLFPSDEAPSGAADGGPISSTEEESFVAGDDFSLSQDEEIVSEPVFNEETAETDLIPKLEKVGLFKSLQFRICAVVIPLAALIPAVFAVHVYMTTDARISRDLNVSAKLTTNRLAMNLEPFLLDRDDIKAGDSISAEMLDKNIFAILVRDRDGKTVFSGRRRDAAWKVIPAESDIRGKYIKSRKDIYDQGKNEKIGSVEVHLAPRFLEETLNKSILNIIAMSLILIATIFIALTLSLRKMILRPIMKLIRIVGTMSLGDLRVDIDVKSKNEIGLLARAIERMQGSLRSALKRMRRRL